MFSVKFPNMQISLILHIARKIVLQTLLHKIARMLENAVLNIFGFVSLILTHFIMSDGGVYRRRFFGCRSIRNSHTFRQMLWDTWIASDFQTHCIGIDSE